MKIPASSAVLKWCVHTVFAAPMALVPMALVSSAVHATQNPASATTTAPANTTHSNLDAQTFLNVLVSNILQLQGEQNQSQALLSRAALQSGDAQLLRQATMQAIQQGQSALAEKFLQRWLETSPYDADAVALAIDQVRVGRTTLEKPITHYLAVHPSSSLYLNWAQKLAALNRKPEAETAVLHSIQQKPDNARAWFILGALQNERQGAEKAVTSFGKYMRFIDEDKSLSAENARELRNVGHLALADTYLQQNRIPLMLQHLNDVTLDDSTVATRLRMLALYGRSQQLLAAEPVLKRFTGDSPEERELRLQAHLLLYKEAGAWQAAWDTLERYNSITMATEPDWLYEQALLSSRLEKYDAMEAQLKTIMTNFPRFAHAWNALGYSLAERGIRLEEARSLLTRALELAPNSPQILDSMGWLAFRSGNAAEAVTYLQRAWDTEPDAEIAAHLGEVLWSQGKQQAARAIWLQGRRLPGGTQHAVLNQTLQRLDVRVPTLYAAPVK